MLTLLMQLSGTAVPAATATRPGPLMRLLAAAPVVASALASVVVSAYDPAFRRDNTAGWISGTAVY